MNPALTTLAAVKQWGSITDGNSDAVLSALILRISQSILGYVNRDSFYQTTYTDYYDGYNGARQLLKNFPVLSVSSLYVGSTQIPSAGTPPNLGCGFSGASERLPAGQATGAYSQRPSVLQWLEQRSGHVYSRIRRAEGSADHPGRHPVHHSGLSAVRKLDG